MKTACTLAALAALACPALSAPVADSTSHTPGYDSVYVNYTGKAPPFPGNMTAPVLATAKGPPGPDDLLFQNLLAAEWSIYSFYQQGVERFNATSFTSLGYLNTTYSSIQRIRDNEAGHLSIFQSAISPTSTKPGPCSYNFGFNSPAEFLALQVFLEIASEAYLTGLAMQAQLNATKGALIAIAETESRHNAWALLTNWRESAFVGPADTVYPYANQILETTNQFISGCPKENPPYPSPNQHLPRLQFDPETSDARPGSNITFVFPAAKPAFKQGAQYHAVFFHGTINASVPLDTKSLTVQIPPFDGEGLIIAALADTPGAPTQESVVAGPLFLLEQPASLAAAIGGAKTQ